MAGAMKRAVRGALIGFMAPARVRSSESRPAKSRATAAAQQARSISAPPSRASITRSDNAVPARWCRLLRPRLSSAAPARRLAAPVAHPSPGAERQTSQGKTRDLRATYLSHLQPHPPGDIGLRAFPLARMQTPHMRFLYFRPALCLQLPSDPASRRRPCCSANGSHYQGP
jgi:hypothetical protein